VAEVFVHDSSVLLLGIMEWNAVYARCTMTQSPA